MRTPRPWTSRFSLLSLTPPPPQQLATAALLLLAAALMLITAPSWGAVRRQLPLVPKRVQAPPSAPPSPSTEVPDGCHFDDPRGPGLYRESPRSKGRVALTFDDGPHRTATPRVLDELAKHRWPATFFLVGHNLRRDTFRLVQRMVADGHTLGTHSYSHDVGMALRHGGERTVELIRGQHEVTRVLIELSLQARDEADFDGLFMQTFGEKSDVWLSATSLRTRYAEYRSRFDQLRAERGARSTVPVVFTRPPGGNPYVGVGDAIARRDHAEALRRAGLFDVLWHDESGDSHPSRKTELPFLISNLQRGFAAGGVILIHDYMRGDALRSALAGLAASRAEVVPLPKLVAEQTGCDQLGLERALASRRVAGAPAVGAVPASFLASSNPPRG